MPRQRIFVAFLLPGRESDPNKKTVPNLLVFGQVTKLRKSGFYRFLSAASTKPLRRSLSRDHSNPSDSSTALIFNFTLLYMYYIQQMYLLHLNIQCIDISVTVMQYYSVLYLLYATYFFFFFFFIAHGTQTTLNVSTRFTNYRNSLMYYEIIGQISIFSMRFHDTISEPNRVYNVGTNRFINIVGQRLSKRFTGKRPPRYD